MSAQLPNAVNITPEEIGSLIQAIPTDVEVPANEKFYKRLRRLVSSRIAADNANSDRIPILPDKGRKLAVVIGDAIQHEGEIPSTICALIDACNVD